MSFAVGDRVRTREGIPGHVVGLHDDPRGTYEVSLEGGLGGGEYSAEEISPYVAVVTTGLASDDYPMLADILIERPPLAHVASTQWETDEPSDISEWTGYPQDWGNAKPCENCDEVFPEWMSECPHCGHAREHVASLHTAGTYDIPAGATKHDPPLSVKTKRAFSATSGWGIYMHNQDQNKIRVDAGEEGKAHYSWDDAKGGRRYLVEFPQDEEKFTGEGHPMTRELNLHENGLDFPDGKPDSSELRPSREKCPASGVSVYADRYYEKTKGYTNNFSLPCPECGAHVKQTRKGEIAVHKRTASLHIAVAIPSGVFAGVQAMSLSEIVGGDCVPALFAEEGDYAAAQAHGMVKRAVDLRTLTATQESYGPENGGPPDLHFEIRGDYLPIVVHANGTDYLLDGHNRAISAINDGSPTQQVWFFDLDQHPEALWTSERYQREGDPSRTAATTPRRLPGSQREARNEYRYHLQSEHQKTQQKEALGGPIDRLLNKTFEVVNEHMPANIRYEPGHNLSYDWCRFRKDQRCMYSKNLDIEATKQAGYNIWIPFDRGWCARNSWDQQKQCPVSEPGPNSGDPHALLDATTPWEQGGQHGGVPLTFSDADIAQWKAAAKEDRCATCGSTDLFSGFYDDDDLSVTGPGEKDATWKTFCNQCGSSWEPKGRRRTSSASFDWHFTSAWTDVRAKAKRIRSEGGVHIISAPTGDDSLSVTAEVKGDHGTYETSIMRAPGTRTVAQWQCGCPWSNYSWGRSGRWKKYEGRMCAHALALVYEAQAQEMFGGDFQLDPNPPSQQIPEPGELPVEVIQPDNTKPQRGLPRAAAYTPPLAHVAAERPIEVSPAALIARGMLEDGVETKAVMAHFASYGEETAMYVISQALSIPFAVRYGDELRMVTDLADNSVVFDDGTEVEAAEVTYPTYDPVLGLVPVVSKLAAGEANTGGVMVAIAPPASICEALHQDGGESVDNMHVTLGYLGESQDIDHDKLTAAVAEMAQIVDPLTGKIAGYGTFVNPKGVVLYCAADVPGLDEWRHVLRVCLARHGLALIEDHGYTPHLTIAYLDDLPTIPELPEGSTSPWGVGEVILAYGGDWERVPVGQSLLVTAGQYHEHEYSDSTHDFIEAREVTNALKKGGFTRGTSSGSRIRGAPYVNEGFVTRTRQDPVYRDGAIKDMRKNNRVIVVEHQLPDNYTSGATDEMRQNQSAQVDAMAEHLRGVGYHVERVNDRLEVSKPKTTASLHTAAEKPNVWELRQQNRDKYPNRNWNSDDYCTFCARPLGENAATIEIGIDGEHIPEGHPDSGGPESQGWWPVGSECIKKLKPPRQASLRSASEAVWPEDPLRTVTPDMDRAASISRTAFEKVDCPVCGTPGATVYQYPDHTEVDCLKCLTEEHDREVAEKRRRDWEEMNANIEKAQKDFDPAAAFGDLGMTAPWKQSTLHDEPEPALPSTDGAEEEDEGQKLQAGLAWLQDDAPPSDGDIAHMASEFLKHGAKAFTHAEQQALINEGEGVRAGNLDRLDITGTHYESLEAALQDEEESADLWIGV